MAGPYGRICRNLFGESLNIKGKLVLDRNANLIVANAQMSNAHISGNLFTNGICEYEMGQGIMIKGNVTLRNGDVLCADIIKANSITGNVTVENLNVANAICGNIVTDEITGKTGNTIAMNANLVIVSPGTITVENLNVENAACGNIITDEITGKTGNTIAVHANLVLVPPGTTIVTESLFTNSIVENVNGGGVNILGNICQTDGYSIQTSKIEPKVSANGVVIDSYIPKNRFGIGRAWGNTTTIVDNGNTVQVVLHSKSFESTFTTTRNIVHPDGNTFVTFQAPSTANINCNYTTALVRTNIVLAAQFIDGEPTDDLVFTILKNRADEVSKFTYGITTPSMVGNLTMAWSDVISVAPDDTLDIFVLGEDSSGNLDAEIRLGSTETFATFEIESFEA